jgi:hypothetical protein
MNNEGFDRSKVRLALNELVRLSISAGVSDSAAGVLGKITAHHRNYKRTENKLNGSDNAPPSRRRYKFRLSAFSRRFSPSSFSLPASSLVTARVTSSVRPCNTRLRAKVEDGSGVNIDGRVNGFFFGCC